MIESEVTPREPAVIGYPYGIDDLVIRVLECGTGEDTLILLHGLGARADRWRLNMGPLAAAGLHVYAVDFPGHGFAEKSTRIRHSVPSYARLVRKFAAEVSTTPVALVGTSMGGHVAATVALLDPDQVRAVVLVGPVGLRPLGGAARQRIAVSVADTSVGGIRAKLDQLLYRKDLITSDWVREEYLINNSPGASDSLAAIAQYFADDIDDDALTDEDLRALAAAMPVLLVWGAEDGIVPVAIASEVQRALDTDVVRIESAGHAPYYENAKPFNAAVLDFLLKKDRGRKLTAHSTTG